LFYGCFCCFTIPGFYYRLFKRFADDAKDLASDDFPKNKTAVVLTANQGLASGLLFTLGMGKTRQTGRPWSGQFAGGSEGKRFILLFGPGYTRKAATGRG